MSVKMKPEWTKAYIVWPQNNIQSHVMINAKKFVPSYEKNCLPTSMTWILGWEYGRVWLNEREEYINKRDKTKPKRIKNDYETWIKKRDAKNKKAAKTTTKRTKT